MAKIYVEVSDRFHQLIKEAAIRRKISIKDMTVMALTAWLKIKVAE